ncbi:hypothetical protein M419DRAFT_120232 [Trichoderma reesei RUT C-30]|uniref:Uncharacterized protein n=1 Tax=Hypocrea jecorina (strain ATCC 56765 / BCRC 32924 / NRRL 11460 / Rut C-30) TaxID=1344414 RepID=A0A024S1V5_HYPJR|nr:hypothetical protein M419DRAFT_120232 [Trichoderma reesei RUT C-30]
MKLQHPGPRSRYLKIQGPDKPRTRAKPDSFDRIASLPTALPKMLRKRGERKSKQV